MVSYSEYTVFIREVANGAMAIASFFVIALFLRYIWENWPYRKDNIAVRAAVALLILTIGHSIRSTSSWLEFIMIDAKIDVESWLLKSWTWFLVATVFVLIGKALIILNFAPSAERIRCATITIMAAIIIPTSTAIALVWYWT